MRNKILIIDGNNLSFKVWSSFTESNKGRLFTSYGIPTTLIFGILRSLDSYTDLGNGKVDNCIICWDLGGGSKFRKGLFPKYKKNRSYKDMGEYFEELDTCREYLDHLGINQAPCKGIEADDVIGWMAYQYSQSCDVDIFSDDKDYYRLLNKHVRIWRPCKSEYYTRRDLDSDMADWKDFKPHYYNLIDALVGQDKDLIPGACDVVQDGETYKMVKFRFGIAKAKKLLEAADYSLKGVKALLEQGTDLVNEAHREQLLKNWDQVILSKKLSRIRNKSAYYSEEELDILKQAYQNSCFVKKIKAKKAIKLMNDLEISSLRPRITTILKKLGVSVVGATESVKTRRIKV